jgi:hypothetical protein
MAISSLKLEIEGWKMNLELLANGLGQKLNSYTMASHKLFPLMQPFKTVNLGNQWTITTIQYRIDNKIKIMQDVLFQHLGFSNVDFMVEFRK